MSFIGTRTWIFASMGASAVLVFCRLAQPGAVVGGKTVSSLVGVVRATSEHRHLADLLPLFGRSGHHHIPVIGDGEKRVGNITQSDVVATLGGPERAPA